MHTMLGLKELKQSYEHSIGTERVKAELKSRALNTVLGLKE